MAESCLSFKPAPSKGIDEAYAPFVSEGFVSLGGKYKIPVEILCDTVATEILIVESILPFSTCTATGKKSPVLGVGLVPLWVSSHHFHLFCDLVCAEVEMGVHPQLPIQEIDIILGNDLAWVRVWKDSPLMLCIVYYRSQI